MPWFAWAMILLLVVSTSATVLTIGKPRDPMTPNVALAILVINSLWIWGIVELAIR